MENDRIASCIIRRIACFGYNFHRFPRAVCSEKMWIILRKNMVWICSLLKKKRLLLTRLEDVNSKLCNVVNRSFNSFILPVITVTNS